MGKKNAAANKAQAEAKAAKALDERQKAAAVRRILEDCAEIKRQQDKDGVLCATEREVASLRQAFRNVMGGTPQASWNDRAVQCDNVLWQLEKDVAANPDAKTGDHDRELGEGERWKFAKIPRRRRTQTFVVSLTSFFTGMPIFLFTAIYLTFNVFTMPFMVMYWVWIFWLGKPKHPIKKREWFTKARWFQHFRDYFPVRLVIPKAVRKLITPNRNYLFCYHPHGVASQGVVPCFASDANRLSELLPGIDVHVQTLGLNFYIPVWRELCILSGMGDASAKTIRKTLDGPPGRSALLVVGGAEEALLASPKTNRLTLSKRKGFVKIALTTGSPLVPVYGFGENNVYGNYADGRPWLQKLLLTMQKKVGFAFPLIKGRGWFNYNFGPVPHRRQIVVVVGEPLDLPKIENPSREDVDKWHKAYCDALRRLYDENKPVYDVATEQEMTVVA